VTLVLSREEIARKLSLDECIVAVERAFRLHGEGRLQPPGILGLPAPGGGFHVKAAFLPLQRSYFAAKVNGNFSGNVGRPAIQGVVYLADGSNGEPLAVMDSIEITILRTGAATAVAAKHLARANARVVTVCGCGNQGRVQLRALSRVLGLSQAFAWDVDAARAQRLAVEMSAELGIAVAAVDHPGLALSRSDVCVTCTPAREPFLRAEDLLPGTFVAAVGADSPDKQELDPSILASSKVVVDVLEQCAAIGELHHALEAGVMTRGQVHAELGEVVAGRKPGRTSDDEVIVFDSTGTALQDAAAAAVVYEKAVGERWAHAGALP
jgi:alanine dehydrogenase